MSEERVETRTIRVLCVDDNPQVCDALRAKLERTPGFAWAGGLRDATELVERAVAERPDVVLLDVDMPGPDPFAAMALLAEACPEVRAVVFSGYVEDDYIDRAVDAGAWGYVSKNDALEELFDVLRDVVDGVFSLSSSARRVYGEP